MSAKTIHDLLPIATGNESPHAYEVFGLEAGEQDMAIVSAAIQSTVNRLREAKSSTDPQVWQTAAKVVQAARVKLADPKQKAELDARFGIIPMAGPQSASSPASTLTSASSPKPSPAKVDPLAGMLPPNNPLAPVQSPVTNGPVTNGPVTNAPVMPAPVNPAAPSSPTVGGVVPNHAAANVHGPGVGVPTSDASAGHGGPQPTVPVIRKNRPPQIKRRRSMLGPLIMTTFMLGMLALIGALIYFLLYGPGTLAITSQDGSLTIKTGPQVASGQSVVAAPRELEPASSQPRPTPKPAFDPVMGKLGGNVPPPPMTTEPAMSSPVAPENMPAPDESMSAIESMAPVEPVVEVPVAAAKTIPDAEADAAIAKASTFIRAGNWDAMKKVTEEVAALPMTAEKKFLAEGLFQLADLATYYRGGIVRGIGTLNTGNDFEVTPDFRIIIVEVGPDLLVVRAGAKNKSYTFDQIPYKLSEKLAAFSIEAGPTRQAAMAAFQAISPLSNESYHDEAIKVFESLNGQIEGAQSEKLVAAIGHLYPKTN
jgi:hypothetical protein